MDLATVAYTVVRILIGLLFIGHGTQKLFGWFGGYGLEGTSQWMGSLGLRPARLWATTSALGETLGGLLLALGFLTPVGAALIIGVMLVAIAQVHAPKGIWNTAGGYEYNLVIIAVMIFIGLTGGGLYSVDAMLNYPVSDGALFAIGLIITLIGVVVSLLGAGAMPAITGRRRTT